MPPASPNGTVPPMPYPSTADRAAPPMPSEVTNERAPSQGSPAGGRFRAAMRRLVGGA
jgi:hypothetical protein